MSNLTDAELLGEMKAALVRLEAVMQIYREGGTIIDRGLASLDRPRLTVIPGTARRRTKPRGQLRLVERAS